MNTIYWINGNPFQSLKALLESIELDLDGLIPPEKRELTIEITKVSDEEYSKHFSE